MPNMLDRLGALCSLPAACNKHRCNPCCVQWQAQCCSWLLWYTRCGSVCGWAAAASARAPRRSVPLCSPLQHSCTVQQPPTLPLWPDPWRGLLAGDRRCLPPICHPRWRPKRWLRSAHRVRLQLPLPTWPWSLHHRHGAMPASCRLLRRSRTNHSSRSSSRSSSCHRGHPGHGSPRQAPLAPCGMAAWQRTLQQAAGGHPEAASLAEHLAHRHCSAGPQCVSGCGPGAALALPLGRQRPAAAAVVLLTC